MRAAQLVPDNVRWFTTRNWLSFFYALQRQYDDSLPVGVRHHARNGQRFYDFTFGNGSRHHWIVVGPHPGEWVALTSSPYHALGKCRNPQSVRDDDATYHYVLADRRGLDLHLPIMRPRTPFRRFAKGQVRPFKPISQVEYGFPSHLVTIETWPVYRHLIDHGQSIKSEGARFLMMIEDEIETSGGTVESVYSGHDTPLRDGAYLMAFGKFLGQELFDAVRFAANANRLLGPADLRFDAGIEPVAPYVARWAMTAEHKWPRGCTLDSGMSIPEFLVERGNRYVSAFAFEVPQKVPSIYAADLYGMTGGDAVQLRDEIIGHASDYLFDASFLARVRSAGDALDVSLALPSRNGFPLDRIPDLDEVVSPARAYQIVSDAYIVVRSSGPLLGCMRRNGLGDHPVYRELSSSTDGIVEWLDYLGCPVSVNPADAARLQVCGMELVSAHAGIVQQQRHSLMRDTAFVTR